MTIKRSRVFLAGVLALALGVFAVPGLAQAAKVSESEGPVLVPDATDAGVNAPTIAGEAALDFRFRGGKVKDRQTLDVNLIVDATGVGLGDLTGVLVGPKGDNANVPFPNFGTSWVNLEFDDQSHFVACNPTFNVRSNCNYLQGGATMTGELAAGFNQVFRGVNPKGTWTLLLFDTEADNPAQSASSVSAELEVKTGRKFEKEGK